AYLDTARACLTSVTSTEAGRRVSRQAAVIAAASANRGHARRWSEGSVALRALRGVAGLSCKCVQAGPFSLALAELTKRIPEEAASRLMKHLSRQVCIGGRGCVEAPELSAGGVESELLSHSNDPDSMAIEWSDKESSTKDRIMADFAFFTPTVKSGWQHSCRAVRISGVDSRVSLHTRAQAANSKVHLKCFVASLTPDAMSLARTNKRTLWTVSVDETSWQRFSGLFVRCTVYQNSSAVGKLTSEWKFSRAALDLGCSKSTKTPTGTAATQPKSVIETRHFSDGATSRYSATASTRSDTNNDERASGEGRFAWGGQNSGGPTPYDIMSRRRRLYGEIALPRKPVTLAPNPGFSGLQVYHHHHHHQNDGYKASREKKTTPEEKYFEEMSSRNLPDKKRSPRQYVITEFCSQTCGLNLQNKNDQAVSDFSQSDKAQQPSARPADSSRSAADQQDWAAGRSLLHVDQRRESYRLLLRACAQTPPVGAGAPLSSASCRRYCRSCNPVQALASVSVIPHPSLVAGSLSSAMIRKSCPCSTGDAVVHPRCH
uniref:TGF_BETA_2 domain-containing protein n=1 Tax=Macrostomum lignano TaxID=282301 RepID=A0A1I8JNZ7_9PLAT